MILDIMIFTLGVLVAGLLALAALPAIWRRAVRLSTARLAQLVPLSAEEVVAERDHLRAAHAVELRRTEQRLERVGAERATVLADQGRLTTRIVALEQDAGVAQQRIGNLGVENAQLTRDLNEAWANAGASALALHAATDLAQKRWLEAAVVERERQALEHQVDQGRTTLAGLETRLIGAATRSEDIGREAKALQADLATASERLAGLEIERDGAREAASAIALQRDGLVAKLTSRDRDVETLTHELDFMREQAASAERRAVDALQAAETLQGRCDVLEAGQTTAAEAARADERRRVAAIEELRADKAALEVALAAARLDRMPDNPARIVSEPVPPPRDL